MLKPDMVIFRSSNDEWGTPQHVFDALNDEFHFNLDPCASAINHKCDHYITIEQDGLKFDWGGVQSFLQSPIQQDCIVGKESIRGKQKARHACGYAYSGKNGYKMVS